MNFYQKDFILIKRKLKSGSIVYYYRLAGEKVHHSTGKRLKWQAEDYVNNEVLPKLKSNAVTLGEYIKPFFEWDECPHTRRLREEGKSISPRYATDQKKRKEKYISKDTISDMPLAEITRGNLLDFRSRLLSKEVGSRTINRTVGILKIIFKEAVFRGDIERDPTIGIGEMKYESKAIGTFSPKELQELFKDRPGVWGDIYSFTAFILAAHAGMRRGEILGLTWGQVDFEKRFISVEKAMTDNGLPKWDKIRGTPITKQCVEALKELRSKSAWVLPDHYVFSYTDGMPRKFTWWNQRFQSAMKNAGFVQQDKDSKQITNPRNLRPHSFRHSINSLLRDAGYDASKIRATLGWSDEKVQEGYTDWQSMDYSKQREIIERELG